jgi:hypothetical protein
MSLFVSLCFQGNHIGGIMVSILASSAIDYGSDDDEVHIVLDQQA